MNKHCHHCGEMLSGRADKKFCDDQCRVNYNNHVNNAPEAIRSINKILKRNRSILNRLLNSGQDKITLSRLHDKGFNFNYHTHMESQRGNIFRHCYDYAYCSNKSGQVSIYKVDLDL